MKKLHITFLATTAALVLTSCNLQPAQSTDVVGQWSYYRSGDVDFPEEPYTRGVILFSADGRFVATDVPGLVVNFDEPGPQTAVGTWSIKDPDFLERLLSPRTAVIMRTDRDEIPIRAEVERHADAATMSFYGDVQSGEWVRYRKNPDADGTRQ